MLLISGFVSLDSICEWRNIYLLSSRQVEILKEEDCLCLPQQITVSLPFAASMYFSGTLSKPSEHYQNMLQLCSSEPPIPFFPSWGLPFLPEEKLTLQSLSLPGCRAAKA